MNTQQIEKRVTSRPDGKLSVHSIFYTIQGEGPFCGTPAVFIRLAGCNLQCPMCDTDYTRGRQLMTVEQIGDDVQFLRLPSITDACPTNPEPEPIKYFDFKLVVITGGEPFRQDLTTLFDELIRRGLFVQVETNGTLAPSKYLYNKQIENRRGVYIVCSPKTGKVNPVTENVACCFKYVMAYGAQDDDGLPKLALNHPAHPRLARPPEGYKGLVYLQPEDSKNGILNKANLDACVQSCMKHGYILQLQIHKIIGLE